MSERASNNIPPSIRKLWHEQEAEDQRGIASNMSVTSSRAIVCHDTLDNGGWKMEEVGLRQLKEDELLIEMVATGVCHTDALIGGIPGGAAPIAFYPRILGHEGESSLFCGSVGIHRNTCMAYLFSTGEADCGFALQVLGTYVMLALKSPWRAKVTQSSARLHSASRARSAKPAIIRIATNSMR